MWKDGELLPGTIIWSADIPKEDVKAVIKAKALPEGTIIKLDRLFFEREDKKFINWCQTNGYPVFCDAKIIEIPVKVLEIAKTYLTHRPYMLNIMANACSTGVMNGEEKDRCDTLKRFADLCGEYNTRSCIVTVLTSKTPHVVDYEYQDTPVSQVLKYVYLAKHAGMTDIVCSPREAAKIREDSRFEMLWLDTPGVRLPDSTSDDQQRIMTPKDALMAGADRLVIGRPLTGKPEDGNIVERIKRNYNAILENIYS